MVRSFFISFFMVFMLALCDLSPAFSQHHGITVKDGKLYRDGKPYRGIGVNYCDLFQELIHNPEERRTLEGLRFLGRKGIPFVRFWACGFWPSDWDLYFENKAEWFRRLDMVVRTAEEAGVGLIPSLFWRIETYPDLFEEYNEAWGDPNSKTRKFMRTYVEEIVTRYKDSPAIWGWEFANEVNLSCDLPNGMEFLGVTIPHLKVNLEKDERNLMTYRIAEDAFRAFAEEVRKYDPYRFITTGNSMPRESGWHNAVEKSWKRDDRDQAFEVFKWMSPAPMDLASVHFYPRYGEDPEYADVKGIVDVLKLMKDFAARLGQPLFVGEFCADVRKEVSMEQFRSHLREILDSLLLSGVDIAAYWVFDYTKDREEPGLVRPNNEYSWVLDMIVEYNRRLSGYPSLSRSKLSVHLIGRFTKGSQEIISSGPRVIKVLDPHASQEMIRAMREYKRLFPNGIVVARIWDRTQGLRYRLTDSPEDSAKDFWERVLKPAIMSLSPEDRKLIDYLEGPNEGETTPTWEDVESARWFGRFWSSLAEIISANGFRPCAGSIAVGNPPGSLEEIHRKLEGFIPALRKLKEVGGAWSYHAYTLKYTTDPGVEIWYSLRYRIFYEYFRKEHPDLLDLPIILTEGGVDRAGDPRTDGWQARGSQDRFIKWLMWFDDQMKRDEFVIGCTLFQIGDPFGWTSFDLEPISGWLSDHLRYADKGDGG